ncbi:MAG: hypothetical protein SOV26_03010 [Candidatus Onthovivens sp.]|nr:hypothetical protein [Candidatus Onthovivens sp.]
MVKSAKILNIEKLFYGTDKEVRDALIEKAHWLDISFYLPGNIEYSISDSGEKHFDFIESLYNGHLLFTPAKVNFDDKEFQSKVENMIKDFRVLTIYSKIDSSQNSLFWVELNFPLLDISLYNKLYPNFYPSISLDEFNSFVDKKNPDICDCIKAIILGKTLQNFIILSKNELFNDKFYCSILKKIFICKGASSDLRESLEEISQKWNIDIEEI